MDTGFRKHTQKKKKRSIWKGRVTATSWQEGEQHRSNFHLLVHSTNSYNIQNWDGLVFHAGSRNPTTWATYPCLPGAWAERGAWTWTRNSGTDCKHVYSLTHWVITHAPPSLHCSLTKCYLTLKSYREGKTCQVPKMPFTSRSPCGAEQCLGLVTFSLYVCRFFVKLTGSVAVCSALFFRVKERHVSLVSLGKEITQKSRIDFCLAFY